MTQENTTLDADDYVRFRGKCKEMSEAEIVA